MYRILNCIHKQQFYKYSTSIFKILGKLIAMHRGIVFYAKKACESAVLNWIGQK